jgi:hypothetical protein
MKEEGRMLPCLTSAENVHVGQSEFYAYLLLFISTMKVL